MIVTILTIYIFLLMLYVITDRRTLIPIVLPTDPRVELYNSFEWRIKDKIRTGFSNSFKKKFKNMRPKWFLWEKEISSLFFIWKGENYDIKKEI